MTMRVNMLINKKTMSRGKSTGVYRVDNDDDFQLEIEYIYTWDDGDYYSPPECDLEIDKVHLNDMDITTFFFDYLLDKFETDVLEYAQENQNE